MDFEDHHQQQQEEKEKEITMPLSHDSSRVKHSGSVGLEGTTTTTTTNNDTNMMTTSFSIKKHTPVGEDSGSRRGTRYRECLKNHAVNIGGHAIDGCGEFMPGGPDGTLDALNCAACGCHRSFHRKEPETTLPASSLFQHHSGYLHQTHQHQQHHQQHQPVYQFFPYNRTSSPYLMATPVQQRPLALPSTSHHSRDDHDDEVSNPSSGGGDAAMAGSGYLVGGSGGSGGGTSRKRFRTKFTAEQKERMAELAERLGWRIQRQDEEAVQRFCEETGVRRHVFKVWMHNNKHTLGKMRTTTTLLEHQQQEHHHHQPSTDA
ncbi:hypothetical protein Droror1_Dr00011153 [Drosera rotundifolia]